MWPPPWSGPQRRGGGEADPEVCRGPTELMMAVMGTGCRFLTPTPGVSAEEAEKWACAWAGGTMERTRAWSLRGWEWARLHGSGEGRGQKQYLMGSRQKQRLLKGDREGATGWRLEGKPSGEKVRKWGRSTGTLNWPQGPSCMQGLQPLSCLQAFLLSLPPPIPHTEASSVQFSCSVMSMTNSWTLLKLMSIESLMPSKHLVLCHPLLLLPSIFPSIRAFSNESALRIRWPKYWSFSFNISCDF